MICDPKNNIVGLCINIIYLLISFVAICFLFLGVVHSISTRLKWYDAVHSRCSLRLEALTYQTSDLDDHRMLCPVHHIPWVMDVKASKKLCVSTHNQRWDSSSSREPFHADWRYIGYCKLLEHSRERTTVSTIELSYRAIINISFPFNFNRMSCDQNTCIKLTWYRSDFTVTEFRLRQLLCDQLLLRHNNFIFPSLKTPVMKNTFHLHLLGINCDTTILRLTHNII